MNINGTLLDYIAFRGGKERTKAIHSSWQSEGVVIATTYDGTLNDHSDTDQSWILEISIPHDNFRHLDGQIPPQDGDQWRAGLNRTKGYQGQFGLWSDTGTPRPTSTAPTDSASSSSLTPSSVAEGLRRETEKAAFSWLRGTCDR